MASTDTVIKIVLDHSGALRGVDDLKGKFQDFGKDVSGLDGKIAGLGAAFTRFAVPIGIAVAALGALAIGMKAVLNAAEEGDALNDIAAAFDRNAEAAGKLSDVYLNELNVATQQQIKNSELMKLANDAAAAGLKPEIFLEVAKAGKVYADAMGQDATGAINTLSNALQTGNERTLKQYGIFIDFDDVIRKYADAHGVAVEALSDLTIVEIKRAAAADALLKKNSQLTESQAGVGDTIAQVRKDYDDSIESIKRAIDNSELLRDAVGVLGRAFVYLVETLASAIKGIVKFADKVYKAVQEIGTRVRTEFATITKGFEVIGETIKQAASGNVMGAYSTALDKVTQSHQKAAAEQKRNDDILGAMIDQYNKTHPVVTKTADAVGQVELRLKGTGDAGKKAAEEAKKLQEAYKALNSQVGILVDGAHLPRVRDLFVEVFNQKAAGILGPEQAKQKIQELAREYGNSAEGIKNASEDMKDAFEASNKALEDLEDAAFDAAKEGFKKLEDAHKEAQKAAEDHARAEKELGESIGQAIAGAFNFDATTGKFKIDFKNLGGSLGQIAGQQIGNAIGSAIGGSIGAIFGPIGAAIGAAAGQYIGNEIENHKLPNGEFKDPSIVKKENEFARKVGGPLPGLLFRATHNVLDSFLGDSRAEALSKYIDKFFNKLGADFTVKGNLTSEFFANMDQKGKEAFNSLGLAFGALGGIVGENAQFMGSVLASNLGGSLNNLQILIGQMGISFEDLQKATEQAFLQGHLKGGEFLATMNQLRQVAEVGIPGAFGAIDEALQNLIKSGGVGAAVMDSLKDLAAESKDKNIKNLDELRRALEASGKFSATQISQVFDALAGAGIKNLEQLANVSVETTAQVTAALENQSNFFQNTGKNLQELLKTIEQIPEKIEKNVHFNVTSSFDSNETKQVAGQANLQLPDGPGLQ